jgi:hypothetical protein
MGISANKNIEGLGCLVLLAICASLAYGVYEVLDSVGWIAHHEDIVVTAQTDWFVGESKDCVSYPLNEDVARGVSAIANVRCDEGPEHRVKVTFYGRVRQPGRPGLAGAAHATKIRSHVARREPLLKSRLVI